MVSAMDGSCQYMGTMQWRRTLSSRVFCFCCVCCSSRRRPCAASPAALASLRAVLASLRAVLASVCAASATLAVRWWMAVDSAVYRAQAVAVYGSPCRF